MPAPTATRLVDKLVAEGLAYRRSDDWDRRRVLVHISPEGHELVARTATELDEAFGTVLADLDPDDRIDLVGLLTRLEQGSSLDIALRAARAAGFAEEDASRDLDGRIRQQSPDDLVSDQRSETDSPSVTGEPVWDSPRTQELATRSCAACHSNQPTWWSRWRIW